MQVIWADRETHLCFAFLVLQIHLSVSIHTIPTLILNLLKETIHCIIIHNWFNSFFKHLRITDNRPYFAHTKMYQDKN